MKHFWYTEIKNGFDTLIKTRADIFNWIYRYDSGMHVE